MKHLLLLLASFFISLATSADVNDLVMQKNWIHGAENCKTNNDPAIDILEVTKDTFILRQSKCISSEAPFIYVFFGEHTVFIQDTGATKSAEEFPVYETISQLIQNRKNVTKVEQLTILVTHSHSHSDHTAGDSQFRGKPDVVLIEPDGEAIIEYFGFDQWPAGEKTIDLGNRQLNIFPIPGHQNESLAVYDSQTQWLLTGDTVYPGRLYVRDWQLFKNSIEKLVGFSTKNSVSAIMGTHIEMSNTPKQDYPVGTEYQPDEAPLPLMVSDLELLNSTLKAMGDQAEDKVLDRFIIAPVGALQKVIGSILGWFIS